jgi:ribonuclease HIII
MSDKSKPLTLFTSPLTSEQAEKLKRMLEQDGFKFQPRPYTLYFAQKDKLSVAVYEKGPKVVVQGRGAEDFVKFRLEPEVMGEARLGYEEVHSPEMFEPHFGIDESGKGDFFGPLVIAGVFVDRDIARAFRDAGVQDSKRIQSDRRIRDLAKLIRSTTGGAWSVVEIGPAKYNQLFEKIGNLNRLLAWGHARVIENLLSKRPDCPRALSDQFAAPRVVQNALLKNGQSIKLEQRTRAESDPAVAAASILARERFIDWLQKKGREHQVTLPRGASGEVKKVAAELVAAHGAEILGELAKIHFKTAADVAPEQFTKERLRPSDTMN